MILDWSRKKTVKQTAALAPQFSPLLVANVPTFSATAGVSEELASVGDEKPSASKTNVAKLVIVAQPPPPKATVPTLPSKEKANALETPEEFVKLVPHHSDMLGVTWDTKNKLCTNSQMTELVAAFRQRDGTAVVLISTRAPSNYLRTFVESLKDQSVIVKSTFATAPRLLAQLYDQASQRKIKSLASDSDELTESVAMQMFFDIIAKGAAANASDFDVVNKGQTADFCFRIDGVRRVFETYPQRLAETFIQNVWGSRAVKAGTRSHTNYLPATRQSMLMSMVLPDGTPQNLRMQTLPGLAGQTCNWRLLPRKGRKQQFTSLEQIGYSADQDRMLMTSLTVKAGLILFLGQTGMGKSTTMDLCFTLHPRRDSIKIVEVADPPEIDNEFVIKHPVRSSSDDTTTADAAAWAGALYATLRSDIDILAIGEIRFAETALIAQESTMTGHLTLGSLHASSPFMAIQRLLEMGLSPSILFSEEGFQLLVSQELHPQICTGCGIKPDENNPFFSSLEELKKIYSLLPSDVQKVRVLGPGCSLCEGSAAVGFRKGRTACVTILQSTPQLRDILLSNSAESRIQMAREYFYSSRKAKFSEPDMTGKTVTQHMLYKVLQGNIALDYFIEATGDLSGHYVYEPKVSK